ncbi:MAG: hypothetical protein DI540_01360 [Sphingobium sp.]|nr:MAG: hypothetical protein DI540_01360 [Sphingobium sp.]
MPLPNLAGEEFAAVIGRFLPVIAGVILTTVRIHSALRRMGSAEWIPDQVRDDDDGEGSFWSSAAKVGHRHGARFWPFGKVHMARSVRERGARCPDAPPS